MKRLPGGKYRRMKQRREKILKAICIVLFSVILCTGLLFPAGPQQDKGKESAPDRQVQLPSQVSVPDMRYYDREGTLNFTIAVILTITGAASIILFLFFLKTKDRALLYFGIFTFLYGIRILSDNFLVRSQWGSLLFWDYTGAIITYVIPIPLVLIFKQFMGWGIKKSVLWVLVLQCTYTPLAIIFDLVSGSPDMSQLPLNNLLVILDILAALFNIYALKHLKTIEMRVLRVMYPFIAVVVINANLVGLGWVPWQYSNETLFVFFMVFILGFVVARRLVDRYVLMRHHLVQADKMIAMGTLVSGVAHEINNPNNFILLNSEILSKAWKDIEPVLDNHFETDEEFQLAGVPFSEARKNLSAFIGDIHAGALRIKNIVTNLKDYARPVDAGVNEDVNMNEVIDSAVHLLENRLKKATQHFSTHLQNPLPTVKGNFQRLEQVIVNLLLNSCQALPGQEKKIEVTTEHDLNENVVRVRVTDEGEGIPEDHLEQLANPFFTTHRESGGLGMGLSIAATIIEEHNGTLLFDSKKGEGTTVTITLPLKAKRTS
jgi:signal transduction histidine kinase